LIASGGLGDAVLLATVLPRFTSLTQGEEALFLLVPAASAKMSFLFGPAVETISVDYNRLAKDRAYRRSISQQLFNRNFRLVVSTDYLRHPKRDEVLIQACEASETVGMEPRPWQKYDRLLAKNHSLYARLFNSGPPILDKVIRWNLFADWLTGKTVPPPTVKIETKNLPAPANLKRPTIVLVPFSAVPQKQSPASLYEQLIDSIPDSFDIVIAGAPNDPAKNPEFESLLNRAGVRYDSSSFEDLVPTLRAAKLVVSVDTATMHLAVAVGAPTLCLASAAYVDEIVPYAPEITPPNVHFLYTPMDCQSCLGNCIHPTEDRMYPCVARLDADGVAAKVLELLEADPA